MKLHFEFRGRKLKNTECFTYQEAKFVLVKIMEQCVASYKKSYNKNIYGKEELRLQYKLLNNIKLIVT